MKRINKVNRFRKASKSTKMIEVRKDVWMDEKIVEEKKEKRKKFAKETGLNEKTQEKIGNFIIECMLVTKKEVGTPLISRAELFNRIKKIKDFNEEEKIYCAIRATSILTRLEEHSVKKTT